jgi:hypothetical protein
MTRQCGTCTKCCDGWLSAKILDFEMGNGVACPLRIKDGGCSIHNDPIRPSLCQNWKCGWLEDDGTLFDEWMRPNNVNLILIRFVVDNIEWYKLAEAGEPISPLMLSYLIQEAIRKNINLEYQIKGAQFLVGTDEFKKVVMGTMAG